MRAIVITGGAAPAFEHAKPWIREAEIVIAADSGVETAIRYGVQPGLVVGDFDSISDEGVLERIPGSAVKRFPVAKDYTDTELALQAAWEQGADDVVLIGGGGGRLDHLLAIVALFERDRHPSTWVSHESVVTVVRSESVFLGSAGDRISFVPLGCEPCVMRSEGLRWPLDGLTWSRGDIGISNEFAGEEVRVRMLSGRLLMIRGVGKV
ncbi:MAG: thiamine diphosphokinase [Spirochaetota bacterium]